MSLLLLSDDLIDTSRIAGEARAQGATMRTARTVELLREMIVKERPSRVMIHLHHPGLDVQALMDWMRGEAAPPPRVIGFGPHVDVECLKAARRAGCDVVLPRSEFFEQLKEWIANDGNGEPR